MLVELFRSLPATGKDGLEGLVLSLLGDAYGLEARLENAGSQGGRDGALFDRATGDSARIDVEVKKYRANKPPGRRMLLGQIAEVRRDRPNTELWVLVSTAALPAALIEDLQDEAFRFDLDILVLDCSDNGVSTLELLAARRESLTLDWVSSAIRSRDRAAVLNKWKQGLAHVRGEPAYPIQEAELAQQLTSRYASEAARKSAHRWLRDHVQGRRQRVVGLNQSLGRKGRAPEVPRPINEAAWREWLLGKDPKTRMQALIGSEGDGKTWTAIDMLLAADNRIPLIVTSNMFDDGGAASLVARALAQQCGGDADRWRARLEPRTKRRRRGFNILLLIDGLNEAPNRRTDILLNEFLTNPPQGAHFDVVVTCRYPFWCNRIIGYIAAVPERLSVMIVGPFDLEDEWPIAKAYLGAGADTLPPSVLEALRNPRLWSFAYDLKDRLGGMTEVTLERLLVEHWRLRIAEREELRVDADSFNRLIGRSIDHIRKSGEDDGALLFEADLDKILRQMVSNVNDFTADLAEVRDGIFFRSTEDHRLVLRSERVPVALGLLLCERILAAGEKMDPLHAVHRAAARFLDDLPASDRVEIIIRTAIFALLAVPGRRQALLPPLLRHWVSLQNFDREFYRALAIVAAAVPELFVRAIEDEASEDEMVGEAAAELSSALCGRRDRPAVREAMLNGTITWLRSYSADHFPGVLASAPEGLFSSPIEWIETLNDFAASFLANLPTNDWHLALAYWAVRRVAIDESADIAYHFDEHLSWLGISGDIDDGEADAIISRAMRAQTPAMGSREQTALTSLLSGTIFEEKSRKKNNELIYEESPEAKGMLQDILAAHELGTDLTKQLRFADLYDLESARNNELWLDLEELVVQFCPDLLGDIVKGLFSKGQDSLKRRRACGFGQFVRDHALLLGDEIVRPIERFVVTRPPEVDGDIPNRGRAVAALFLVTDPSAHAGQLAAIKGVGKLRGLDLTGFNPKLNDEVLAPLLEATARGDVDASFAFATAAAYGSELGGDGEDTRALLSKIAVDLESPAQPAALRALCCRNDVEADIVLAAALPNAMSANSRLGAESLSTLIVRATPTPNYRSLRGRIKPALFPAAAEADGSPDAFASLARDFDAILLVHGEDGWPARQPVADIRVAQDVELTRRRKGRFHRESRDSFVFSRETTINFLNILAAHLPDHRTNLLDQIANASDGALVAIEGSVALLSALAFGSDAGLAVQLMRRLWTHDNGRTDHKGLLVTPALRFAFERDEPAVVNFRNELADEAWTDQALLDLVCIAELEGRAGWLEDRICIGAKSRSRSHRVQSILLRGWRGSAADRYWFRTVSPSNGYERFVVDIAKERCERRTRLSTAMDEYACAPSVEGAWLAYRKIIHCADHRLLPEMHTRNWPQVLPRQLSTNLDIAAADFERYFKRNEGDLTQSFAAVIIPRGVPPWNPVKIYSSN